MYEVLVLALSMVIIGTVIIVITVAVAGIICGLLAGPVSFMIVQGYVTWPLLETRFVIPVVRKIMQCFAERPVPPNIVRYLDSARDRGLI